MRLGVQHELVDKSAGLFKAQKRRQRCEAYRGKRVSDSCVGRLMPNRRLGHQQSKPSPRRANRAEGRQLSFVFRETNELDISGAMITAPLCHRLSHTLAFCIRIIRRIGQRLISI